MTSIVGILGGKGSGKSTIAARLEDYPAIRAFAIADKIKELTAAFYDLDERRLHEDKDAVDARFRASPRQLVCRVGDALRRTYGDNFSVKRIYEHIVGHYDDLTLAVIADVRYVSEANYLRAHGAYLWRVHYADDMPVPEVTHDSEREWMLPRVDFEIHPPARGVLHLREAADNALLHGFVRAVL